MATNRLFGVVISGLITTACGTYTNPSNPSANYAQDKYACEQEALRLMPTIIAYRYETTPSECRARHKDGKCSDVVPPINKAIPFDTNESGRSSLAYSCIKAKGWMYQSK